MARSLAIPSRFMVMVFALWAFGSTPGQAQRPDDFPASGRAARARAAEVPNVPDRNGCVRQCEFDLNPCDTPLEKKLDGRCTLKD